MTEANFLDSDFFEVVFSFVRRPSVSVHTYVMVPSIFTNVTVTPYVSSKLEMISEMHLTSIHNAHCSLRIYPSIDTAPHSMMPRVVSFACTEEEAKRHERVTWDD